MVRGIGRNRIACIDSASGMPALWNPNADHAVYSLILYQGKLLAAGLFTTIAGQSRNRLAGLDTAIASCTAFDPDANNAVRAMHLSGDTLFIGGDFTTVSGMDYYRLAQISLVTDTLSPWNPGTDNTVTCVYKAGNRNFAGGLFDFAGSIYHPCLAGISSQITTGWTGSGTVNDAITLYPNPSEGTFFLYGPIGAEMMEVYNAAGIQVLSLAHPLRLQQIDLSAFPPGIYLVRIVTKEKVLTAKAILR